MSEVLTFSHLARALTIALFAFPFSGGDVTAIFSLSAYSPMILSLFEFGCILARIIIPPSTFLILIIYYTIRGYKNRSIQAIRQLNVFNQIIKRKAEAFCYIFYSIVVK